MPTSRMTGDRRGSFAAAVTVVLLLLGGLITYRALTGDGAPPQPSAAEAADTTGTGDASPTPSPRGSAPRAATSPSPSSTATATATATPAAGFGPLLGPSAPVSLVIPSIGVDTTGIVDLAIDKDGKLEAPADFGRAGWWAAGPSPGEFGPAVIGAHVDSKAGPAVFYRLGALKRGAMVSVGRKDGSTARFVVDRIARYAKADFPTPTVYADTKGRAELRLITCGGAFDASTGHYVDNIVAFAHLLR